MLEGQRERLASLSRTALERNVKCKMQDVKLKEDRGKILMGNAIEEKSFEFAVKIVKIALELKSNQHYELGSQILRSGTSIGANVAEAQSAQSKKDFVSKLNISLKEANETEYWLRLLEATGIITLEQSKSLTSDVRELRYILISILKSSKCAK